MFPTIITLRILLCASLFLLLPFGAYCQETIESPNESNPLSERWRWVEFEIMRGNMVDVGAEDPSGNLWFADGHKIYKYDGYELEAYPYPDHVLEAGNRTANSNQPFVIASDMIALATDHIIVAIENQILRFNGQQWQTLYSHPFIRYRTQRMQSTPDGDIIFGAPDGLYTLKNGVIQKHVHSDVGFSKLNFDPTTNSLWLCEFSSNKFYRCNWENGEPEPFHKWDRFQFDEHIDDNFSICVDKMGNAWISTKLYQITLLKIDPHSLETTFVKLPFKYRQNEFFRIDLKTDPRGHPMVRTRNANYVQHFGTWKRLNPPDYPFGKNREFSFYRKNGNLIYGNRRGSIYEIHTGEKSWRTFQNLIFQCETSDRKQWFMRVDGRVLTLDLNENRWALYPESIDTANALMKSKNGDIWVMGSHQGVASVARWSGEDWIIDSHPKLGPRICYHSGFAEMDGSVVFGSGVIPGEFQGVKGGLVRYEKTDEGYKIDPTFDTIPLKRTFGIERDDEGNYLVGEFGIKIVVRKEESFETKRVRNLSGLWIDDFLIDSQKNTWVALWGIGVRKYADLEKWYEAFDHNSDLNTNRVGYLMEDRFHPGRIWGASQEGLVWYQDGTWTNIQLPNALNIQRESGSLRQTSDGAIWINHFHRDWYDRAPPTQPNNDRVFEDFRSYRFTPDKGEPTCSIVHFDESVSEDGDTFISWKGKDLWGNTPFEELKYSYRINGGEWSPYSRQKNAVLVNLSSGEHVFDVRARDLVGNVQSVPSSVVFRVMPPIWLRPWFILVTTGGILTVAGLVSFIILLRIRHIKELEEAKISFFTNISHELRNPLTVIEGPLQSVLKKTTDKESIENLNLALKSAQKTTKLLDQLLDFRKSDKGKLEGHLVKGDIVEFIKETISTHLVTAFKNNQELKITCDPENLIAEFDEERLPKIVDNLVSNALKYSHQGDVIDIQLTFDKESQTQLFEITDNGLGIPKSEQQKIFEPFYRSSRTDKLQQINSTGLGLPLVKELVESMHGKIHVESPVQKGNSMHQGSRFRVQLPIKTINLESEGHPAENESIPFLHTLLIVEDDSDILSFLYRELKKSFRIQKASNGKEAWESIHSDPPELVLTDVMMPEMNGMELCSLIKSTDATSHIPVFMLSALDDDDTKLKGLESKADDYLSKPIKIDLLNQKLANHFENQNAIAEKIKSEVLNPTNASSTLVSFKPGNHILERIVAIVLENISDASFDVEKLAKAMHMSRATLYRKIKGLTGDSSITFIQKIRMKHASELLVTGNYSVTEVCDQVGIQELSYFSACFKKYYHCTPTEYISGKRA